MSTNPNKKTITATVFTDYDGETHQVSASTLIDLFQALADLSDEYIAYDADILVSLPDGQRFRWDFTVWNYYAKGRIELEEVLHGMMEVGGAL